MLKAIPIFLRRHGFLIVMVGFMVSFLFMAVYLGCIYRHASVGLRTAAFYSTFAGIGIFAVGRVGVFLENRARRRKNSRPDYPSKDQA
jgi:multidrug transporter EmrE-like cation transporter